MSFFLKSEWEGAMLHAWRNSLHLPGRRPLLIGLALAIVLVAGLVGGILLLQRHAAPAPVFRHVPNAPNLGASLLSLSTPSDSPNSSAVSRLTMLRTSDGATLWQYDLPGILATGGAGGVDEALQQGTLQIANGVIYFAIVDAPANTSTSPESLMALRASDDTLLWRQEVQAACAQMVGVSDGVVICSGTASPGTDSHAAPPMIFSGYDAKTGKRVWQRAVSDITGANGIAPPTLIDGVLYCIGGSRAVGSSQRDSILYALQASTGRTLWTYTQPSPTGMVPLAGNNGVALVLAIIGDIFKNPTVNLTGIQESTGTILWQDTLTSATWANPYGGPWSSGIFFSNGLVYFSTFDPNTKIPKLEALQLQDGATRWSQPITAQASDLWYLTMANGTLYTVTALPYEGIHPTYQGTMVQAFQASNGAPLWQYRAAQMAPTSVTAPTSASVTVVSGTTVSGIAASDGTAQWQRTFDTAYSVVPSLMSANGSTIVSYITKDSAGYAWVGHICALQPETGASRWCDDPDGIFFALVEGP